MIVTHQKYIRKCIFTSHILSLTNSFLFCYWSRNPHLTCCSVHSHSSCHNECSGEESFHEGKRIASVFAVLFCFYWVDLPDMLLFYEVKESHRIPHVAHTLNACVCGCSVQTNSSDMYVSLIFMFSLQRFPILNAPVQVGLVGLWWVK